jgi:RimJ/RimL family protein N-acetyltransferase
LSGDPAPLAGWQPPPRPVAEAMQGRYVRLEPLTPEDHAADLFRAYSGDDRLWRFLGYGPFVDAADYARWVRAMAGGSDPMFFALRDLETGRCGGVAAWLRIAPEQGVIEVGHICLAPEIARTPAATEAMALMMAWAFKAGYRRYEWKCDALNLASRRAAERLGFSFEGVFRQAAVVKGRNRDTAWYSVIDAEWPALQRAFAGWLDPANFNEDGRQRQRLAAFAAPG